LGVSAVPSMCIQQMKELGAHCVPLTRPDISCQVGILTHQELSVAAQALRDVLRDTVQAPRLDAG
ncbi:MAG: LysR family transcriptional regulator, partial [Halomonas sp.]